MWAHGYSGPTVGIGGAYFAYWTTQELTQLSPFICIIFASLLQCGTNVLVMCFLGDVAARDVLDQRVRNIAHRSRGLQSTWLLSKHVRISKPLIA